MNTLPIPGFPDYTIDRFGNVFSSKVDPFKLGAEEGIHELSQSIALDYGRWGNVYVTLSRDGKGHTKRVSSLLMLVWRNLTLRNKERDYRRQHKTRIAFWTQRAHHLARQNGGLIPTEHMALRPLPANLLALRALDEDPEDED